MAALVYLLCFLTSVVCTILLLHGYKKNGTRLLLWTGLCFVGLALNNALLFYNRVMAPNVEMFWLRTVPAFIGLLFLLYGLVWEAE